MVSARSNMVVREIEKFEGPVEAMKHFRGIIMGLKD